MPPAAADKGSEVAEVAELRLERAEAALEKLQELRNEFPAPSAPPGSDQEEEDEHSDAAKLRRWERCREKRSRDVPLEDFVEAFYQNAKRRCIAAGEAAYKVAASEELDRIDNVQRGYARTLERQAAHYKQQTRERGGGSERKKPAKPGRSFSLDN